MWNKKLIWWISRRHDSHWKIFVIKVCFLLKKKKIPEREAFVSLWNLKELLIFPLHLYQTSQAVYCSLHFPAQMGLWSLLMFLLKYTTGKIVYEHKKFHSQFSGLCSKGDFFTQVSHMTAQDFATRSSQRCFTKYSIRNHSSKNNKTEVAIWKRVHFGVTVIDYYIFTLNTKES